MNFGIPKISINSEENSDTNSRGLYNEFQCICLNLSTLFLFQIFAINYMENKSHTAMTTDFDLAKMGFHLASKISDLNRKTKGTSQFIFLFIIISLIQCFCFLIMAIGIYMVKLTPYVNLYRLTN